MRTSLGICLVLIFSCLTNAEAPVIEKQTDDKLTSAPSPAPEKTTAPIKATQPTEQIKTDASSKLNSVEPALPNNTKPEAPSIAAGVDDKAQIQQPKNQTESLDQSISTQTTTPSKKEVLNEVRAVIGGPSETVLILTQDIRPWLDGTPRSLRDLVIEQLILFDAESLKMQTTEEEVDRVILQIQKNNNYTHENILEMLKAIDYTMEEFRNDLKRKHIVDMMLDYRVRNDKRMAVTEDEVKAYWNAHAENQFRLIAGHVKTTLSKEALQKALNDGTLKDSIDWGSPFAVNESQLPAERQFIKDHESGEIVLIEPETDGFEVTKLISKGKESLKSGTKEQNDKRYKNIENTIRAERYSKIFEEYEQKLLKNAKLSFKHESDRIAVMTKKEA